MKELRKIIRHKSCEQVASKIKEKLLKQLIIHLDETRFQVNNDGRWQAGQMHELLMKLHKAAQAEKKIHRWSYEWSQYKQICRLAMKEESSLVKSPRGRPTKTKGQNLAELLRIVWRMYFVLQGKTE